MIELCRIVGKKDGIYTTHMRGETDTVLDSVAKPSGGGEVGNLRPRSRTIRPPANRTGVSAKTLQLIDDASDRGLDITCDVYPYVAGSTMLGPCCRRGCM